MTTTYKTLTGWAYWVLTNKYPLTGPNAKRSAIDVHRAVSQFVSFANTEHPTSLTPVHLATWRDSLLANGNSSSTINTKLSYVSRFLQIMREYGVEIPNWKIPYVQRVKPKKWWMTTAHRYNLTFKLDSVSWGRDMLDYLDWTIETGLRVEETLRLVPSDFEGLNTSEPSLIVPGTKTEGSRVKLPISEAAAAIIMRRTFTGTTFPTRIRIFDVSYSALQQRWERCREWLGVTDEPTATLKSMRRVFAATCLQKGIPERIIQELMRHSSMKTTMEYLHLVGLVDNQETRDMLNRQLTAKGHAPLTLSPLTADDLRRFEEHITAELGPKTMGFKGSDKIAGHKATLIYTDEIEADNKLADSDNPVQNITLGSFMDQLADRIATRMKQTP